MAHMENQTSTPSAGRRAAVGALAIVGFIALVIIGIGLAIYTARYLPDLSSKVGGGAVSFSSLFHKKPNADLQVVTSTTTLPFGTNSTTTASVAVATSTSSKTSSGGSYASAGASQGATYTTPVSKGPVALYGNPDLSATVTDVGYLSRSGDTTSFVGSNSVPQSNDGAVKFTITNVGTNATGSWNFSVDIPTSPSQHFVSPDQASLNPGDSVDYVLGFSRGFSSGQQITVTVTADPNNRIIENSKTNNVSSRWVIVQ